jgi:hypothetical protein
MLDESPVDPFWVRLCAKYSEAEITEIEQYLTEWDASTYTSVAHSVVDHALRKNIEYLTNVSTQSRRSSRLCLFFQQSRRRFMLVIDTAVPNRSTS